MAAEAGDQLAVVEAALEPEVSSIHRQLILGLESFEVQIHPQMLAIGEDPIPLLHLRDVESVMVPRLLVAQGAAQPAPPFFPCSESPAGR